MTERFKFGVVLLFGVYLLGGVGYKYLSPESPWEDCLFMSVITIASVGYQEVIDPRVHPAMRLYTMTLIFVGIAVHLYAVSIVTAFFVEGDLNEYFWKRRMEKRIRVMENHYIVCGGGEVGQCIIEELIKTKRDFVVIERDPAVVLELRKLGDIAILEGLADEEETLEKAGVERAAGAIVVLSHDRDNLVATLAIRTLNSKIRIVSEEEETGMAMRLKRAGADAIVNTANIGGLRLVSEMVRPSVVSFLDAMLRDPHQTYRFEELTITPASSWANHQLKDLPIRSDFKLLVAAARKPDQGLFTYNPDESWLLEPGQTLIVLGEANDVRRARGFAQPA